ncbi:PLP-dependent aminotransferase family protein [Priestia megaterium]|uniref:MocR-like pyridoxine biosynthesis transcription factor PdxR n=1 Tax=Priestia megaterium TaxID=1404 RepID=UPI003D06C885
MLELMPLLDKRKTDPLYMQLYTYIKKQIQKGTIPPHEKLPSKRKLALHLSISQNTVEAAYVQLEAEGYIEILARKGAFVKEIKKEVVLQELPPVYVSLPQEEPKSTTIDFSHGKIDVEKFSYNTWKKLTVQAIYHGESQLFYSGHPQGELLLRQEIAAYLYHSRGVRCTAEQIVIGAGTQYLMWLLSVTLGKEKIIGFENPGFHRTRHVFQEQGMSVLPISLDDSGLKVKELKESGANAVYITPSHQFPIGMVMPIARRLELLEWAAETNGYIIEDDYDGEFRYKGKPIPALQGLDQDDRVIYTGTFSKSLMPSLRISYAVLPHRLLPSYVKHCGLFKQPVSRFHQHTLFLFMKEGHWERHLNKMRTAYRKKQALLLDCLTATMGERVDVIGEYSGLHILLKVKNGMSEQKLIEAAAKQGVTIYPTAIYYHSADDNTTPYVLLGFAGLSDEEIKTGVNLLFKAWFEQQD